MTDMRPEFLRQELHLLDSYLASTALDEEELAALNRIRARISAIQVTVEAQVAQTAAVMDSIFNAPLRMPVPRDQPPEAATVQALRKYIRRGEGTHSAVKDDQLVGWSRVQVRLSRDPHKTDDTVDDGTGSMIYAVVEYTGGKWSDDYAFEVTWLGYHQP